MPRFEPWAQAYNAAIPGLVETRRAAGRKIEWVDVHGAVGLGGLSPDGIHPSAAGHGAIARTWYGALRSVVHTPMAPQSSTLDR